MATTPYDPWTAGVQQWWSAMEAGRRHLEDLGRSMQPSSAVRPDDLGPLVEALELVEGRLSRLEERGEGDRGEVKELRAQLQGVDARLARVEARVEALLRQGEGLTAALEALVERLPAPGEGA